MKQIGSLVEDIYGLFEKRADISDELVEQFGKRLAETVRDRLCAERPDPTLRVSNLGSNCNRQLWYTINQPELAEPLPAKAKLKFLYGDILEELLLFCAEASGHTVTDRQREVDLHGVKGHIDAIVDDHLVDVKSASSFSFGKFSAGLTPDVDSFGYLTQLSSYGNALGRSEGSFLAVDKQLGSLVLDTHKFEKRDLKSVVESKQAMLKEKEPPARAYLDEKDGESGNRKLGVACSYCSFKRTCWPSVRTFLYSGSPRYLTKVVRQPMRRDGTPIPEVK